jgi:hypothetical protein
MILISAAVAICSSMTGVADVVSVVGAATEVCGVYFFQTDHRFLA